MSKDTLACFIMGFFSNLSAVFAFPRELIEEVQCHIISFFSSLASTFSSLEFSSINLKVIQSTYSSYEKWNITFDFSSIYALIVQLRDRDQEWLNLKKPSALIFGVLSLSLVLGHPLAVRSFRYNNMFLRSRLTRTLHRISWILYIANILAFSLALSSPYRSKWPDIERLRASSAAEDDHCRLATLGLFVISGIISLLIALMDIIFYTCNAKDGIQNKHQVIPQREQEPAEVKASSILEAPTTVKLMELLESMKEVIASSTLEAPTTVKLMELLESSKSRSLQCRQPHSEGILVEANDLSVLTGQPPGQPMIHEKKLEDISSTVVKRRKISGSSRMVMTKTETVTKIMRIEVKDDVHKC